MKRGVLLTVLLGCLHGAMAVLPDGLYAAFDTTMGSFTCRLDYAEAPLTCANFAGLADGSKTWLDIRDGRIRNDPFYDGLIFHRVIDGFMIQGGDPLATGAGGPGYSFPDQFGNLTHAKAGMLSMANSGLDSNGSQFFITLVPTTWLDGKHVVFGEVVDGMDVVYAIGKVPVASERPVTDVVMNHVQILRIGTEAENLDFSTEPLPEVLPLQLSLTPRTNFFNIVSAISNQCEQIIYGSTNLIDWVGIEKNYWSLADETWTVSSATNQVREFFRGSRVFYPQAIPGLATDVAGHQLKFTKNAEQLIFNPQAGGKGTCTLWGTPDQITSWNWWPSLRVVTFKVYTAGGRSFAFQIYHGSPDNGKWNGYKDYPSWNYMEEWNYTDTPPSE